MSETSKYRHLTAVHCVGNTVDLGSQGDPVVPDAIQVELPQKDYLYYTNGHGLPVLGSYRGDARVLPFKDGTLDTVYSSHLLEDFWPWEPIIREWARVIRSGGKMVILVPDTALWERALANGQPPNCSHRHTGKVGELSDLIGRIGGFRVLEDRLTAQYIGDYSILFVAQRL